MKALDIRSPYSKLRKGKFVDDLTKRDGFETPYEYLLFHWGKALCEYYVKQGPSHPRYDDAKDVLEWAKNNGN